MAKQIEQLTDLKLRQLRTPGRYADGQGLYVQVTASKKVGGQFNRSWLVRVRVPVLVGDQIRTQVREIGLGHLDEEGRDSATRTRPHRSSVGLGDGSRASDRGIELAVSRPSA